jgi:RimJ/RimL family protein N-acetyltransferase
MNKRVTVICKDFPSLKMVSASETDQDSLRRWKNDHRTSFFYQEIIQPEQQLKWFQKYQDRSDDYMFMVEEDGCPIGCMAFRIIDENTIDLYNIIRGDSGTGNVSMRDAMHVMLAYIKERFTDKEIKCDVLKDNPAVLWYQKCGFAILEEKEYYIMGINKKDIPAIKIESKEE